jgi:hypothetical protein
MNRMRDLIFRAGFDPIGQQTFDGVDGCLQPFLVSTVRSNANIGTLNYFIVFGARSHTSGVPYSNLIRFVSVWSTAAGGGP